MLTAALAAGTGTCLQVGDTKLAALLKHPIQGARQGYVDVEVVEAYGQLVEVFMAPAELGREEAG